MKSFSLLTATALMGACGADGIPAGDDLGSGSTTLLVVGSVEASNLIANATAVNDYATSFEVSVTREGATVDDATVIVESDAGAVELTWTPEGQSGAYRGSQVGYSRRYVLDVVAGDDFLEGVRVEGPGIHSFVSPQLGASVPWADVEVTWDRGEAADTTEIESRETDKIAISDSGTYTFVQQDLRHDDGETEDERVDVWRGNEVSPRGGVGGSRFTVRVRNQTEFRILP